MNSFLWKYTYGMRKTIFLIEAMIVIGLALGLITPSVYGSIIDSLVGDGFYKIPRLLVVYFTLLMLGMIFGMCESYFCGKLSIIIENRLKDDVYNKLIRTNMLIWDKMSVGEIESRYHDDTGACVSYFVEFITSIIYVLVNTVISGCFILYISVRLSCVALLFFPISMIVMMLFRKKFRIQAERNKQYTDKLYSSLNEVTRSIEGIKAFCIEGLLALKNARILDEGVFLRKKNMILEARFRGINEIITTLFSLSIVAVAATLISNEKISIGGFVAFNMYVQRLYSSITEIQTINRNKQEMQVSINRLQQILDLVDENNSSIAETVDISANVLRMDNVSFSYDNGNDVISEMVMNIEQNGMYAIVGRNGCGKTTLFRLLISLYSSRIGEVLIDDIEIKKISVNNLRSNILYIGKEPFFIEGTIYENLCIGNTDIAKEEIEKGCELVEMDQFIKSLPQGYDTVLHSCGSELSSGQAQRLNFLRAYLSPAKVILMDEITSDVDGYIEKKIISLIRNMAKEKIIICISHRKKILEASDGIFLISNGRVTSIGTHSFLIENDELYRSLFL